MNNESTTRNESAAGKAELFLNMLNEDHVYLYNGLDYERICQALEISRQELDAVLIEQTGHGGEELEMLMYTSYRDYLSKKYGLRLGSEREF